MTDLDYVFDPDAPEWPATPDGWFQVGNVTPPAVLEAIAGRLGPEGRREIDNAIVVFGEAGKRLPRVLVEYLTKRLREDAEKKASSRGRPRTDDRILIERAVQVLMHQLNGIAYENAIATAATELKTSDTRVKEAWSRHDAEALVQLTIERQLDGNEWTKRERAILAKISQRIKRRQFAQFAKGLSGLRA